MSGFDWDSFKNRHPQKLNRSKEVAFGCKFVERSRN